MPMDFHSRRIRILGWFLFGLGAFMGLDALIMHLTHYEQGAEHVLLRVFGLKAEFTRAQDLMGVAIIFGVLGMIAMVVSFKKSEASHIKTSKSGENA